MADNSAPTSGDTTAQWIDIVNNLNATTSVFDSNATESVGNELFKPIAEHEIEDLKRACQLNVEKELKASTVIKKKCNKATAYYKHIQAGFAQGFEELIESVATIANEIKTPEAQKKADLLEQTINVLEKQVEVLIKHDIAHHIDVNDAFDQYCRLLREQFLAVASLDRAQLSKTALAWKQHVLENQSSSTETTLQQIGDLTAKLSLAQFELAQANADVEIGKHELAQKSNTITKQEKKLAGTEEQMRKVLENSLKVSTRANAVESKNRELQDTNESLEHDLDQLFEELEMCKLESDELKAKLEAVQKASESVAADLREHLYSSETKHDQLLAQFNAQAAGPIKLPASAPELTIDGLPIIQSEAMEEESLHTIKEAPLEVANGNFPAIERDAVTELQETIRQLKERIDTLELGKLATDLALENKTKMNKELHEQLEKIERDFQARIDKRDDTIKQLKKDHKAAEQALKEELEKKEQKIKQLEYKLATYDPIEKRDEIYLNLCDQIKSIEEELKEKTNDLEELNKYVKDVTSVLPTDPESDIVRNFMLMKRNDELLKTIASLEKDNALYKTLLESDVATLNNKAIITEIFEAGLHREAPEPRYVSSGSFSKTPKRQ